MCISKATQDAYFNPEVKVTKYSMAMAPCYGIMWIVWIVWRWLGFLLGCVPMFLYGWGGW